MDLTDDRLTSALREYAAKKDSFNLETELRSLAAIQADRKVARFLEEYEFVEFASAGGSGIVLRVRYVHHQTLRALKIPRAKLLEASTLEGVSAENSELDALEKVSHEHVIRLYDAHKIKPGQHLMVSEWVTNADLDRYIIECCDEIERSPSDDDINGILRVLSELVRQIASALRYLHETLSLYHFDIKPANILVDRSRKDRPKAYLTDFGFARQRSRYEDDKVVRIGFTWRYAHPRLADPEKGRMSQTQAKAKTTLLGKELGPRFDLFAFARSIQECLKLIQLRFRDKATSLYHFDYLHLVACLCLDGRGTTSGPSRDEDFIMEDAACGLPLDLFVKQKFEAAAEAEHALNKLVGLYRIEHDLPELDPWYGATINASDVAQINLTPRLRSLITHPFFKRLEGEPQLGMLKEVFPTATHSRGNHSLGVYGAACRYVSALYWDPDNPICRILMTTSQIKALLVASLLHDLGQTAFGHDVEEIDEKLFSHEEFTKRLLNVSLEEEGRLGPAFHTRICAPEPGGWGLDSIEPVSRVIGKKATLPIEYLLNEIIDGPLDADKLDYLVRDSVDCRVQYGHGMDIERFLHSLTCVSEGGTGDDPNSRLQLGIKAKGKASADAFVLTRAQMYQALYWHHTFRAIKAMFLTSVAYTMKHYLHMDREAAQARFAEDIPAALQNAYFEYVFLRPYGIQPRASRPAGKRQKGRQEEGLPIDDILRSSLAKDEPPGAHGGSPTDRTLAFFYLVGPENARKLIEALVNRQLFKRVLEVPLVGMDNNEHRRLAGMLSSSTRRADITRRLEDEFKAALTGALQRASAVQESLKADKGEQLLVSAWVDGATMAIDAPARELDTTQRPPKLVSDYKRKYTHETRGVPEATRTALWSKNMPELMRESAYFRVFVKPEVHDLLLRFMNNRERRAVLNRVFELRG